MKKLQILIAISLVVTSLRAQNNLPYLGQTPPGLNALRFPPDSLLADNNWMWHGSPMFKYDGLEMFWTEYSEPTPDTYTLEIYAMRVEDNNWSAIQRPAFADTSYKENNPFFNGGDDTLYYYSARTNSFINQVVRTTSGWDQPQTIQIPIPPGYLYGNTFSVSKNKDIYLDLLSQRTNESNIYISQYQSGNYLLAQVLGTEINSGYDESCPFIDPDESYLIFGSNRPGGYGGQIDLYICFKNEDQTWTDAINMGYEINSTGAFFPIVTLDKQYLFFNTAKPGDIGYNPYWISADIIDSLHILVSIDEAGKSSEHLKIYQNHPNPVINQTTFLFELEHSGIISFEIYSQTKGRILSLIENKFTQKGKHSIVFDASELPSGMYFFKLTSSEGVTLTRKMVVL